MNQIEIKEIGVLNTLTKMSEEEINLQMKLVSLLARLDVKEEDEELLLTNRLNELIGD